MVDTAYSAASAAQKAYRTDCELRNRQEQAETNNDDSLARAEKKTHDTAVSIAKGDAISSTLLKNPFTNDSAMKRVAEIGTMLADIHQTAFGQLDSTMQQFSNYGISQPPIQTLRSDGHWAAIANPPDASDFKAFQDAVDERQREVAAKEEQAAREQQAQLDAANEAERVRQAAIDDRKERRAELEYRAMLRAERYEKALENWKRDNPSLGYTGGSVSSSGTNPNHESRCGNGSGCSTVP